MAVVDAVVQHYVAMWDFLASRRFLAVLLRRSIPALKCHGAYSVDAAEEKDPGNFGDPVGLGQ